ncbi:MAG TPA: DUF58 domain-containing protein, partial [Actinomycetota bacterium]|nr:DUF58 domain-containing protein [Actinomycetota bacterium]
LAAIMLGAVMAGLVLPARSTRGVVVARRAPAEIPQGDEVLVDVTVHGARRGVRRGLLVHDPLLDAADLWVGTVAAGERVEVSTLRVARRRGVHDSEPVVVRSSAPFGVAERRRSVRVESAGTLVLPMVEPLGPVPFVRLASTTERALHAAPRRGHGPEFFGIREYRPGDSMRHVHWASTARTGAVMVRELEQEETRKLAIVVDASRDASPRGEHGLTPLDRACSAAASIALAALAHGHGARLVTGAGSATDAGTESVADEHVLLRADERALLERLATLAPSPRIPALPALASSLESSLRGVETVVLVFPTWKDNGAGALTPAVASLARHIPTVVAVPVVIEDGASHRLRERDIEGLGQRLRAAGASVHPWREGTSLADALGIAGDLEGGR